jgi:hypothetical protein
MVTSNLAGGNQKGNKLQKTKTPPISDVKVHKNRWSSYMTYCSYSRKKLGKQYPEKSNKDIIVECANRWRALSDAEKMKWKDEADKLNALEREASLN